MLRLILCRPSLVLKGCYSGKACKRSFFSEAEQHSQVPARPLVGKRGRGTDARLLPHPGRRGRGDGGGALPGPPQPPRPERPPCAGALAAAPSWLLTGLPLGDRLLRAQESNSATERPGTRPPKGGGGGGAGRSEPSAAAGVELPVSVKSGPRRGPSRGPCFLPTQSPNPCSFRSRARTCDVTAAPPSQGTELRLREVVVGPKPPGWDVDSQS